MASNERDLTERARPAPAAAAPQAASCGADELKGLLAHITEQILDADRRHTEVLRQMQQRLAQLGEEARSIRAASPELDGGMDQIADRMTVAGAPMALRSAAGMSPKLDFPRTSEPIDPFDVLDSSRPSSASDPWDADAAEALVRLHESGETGFASHFKDPEAAKSPAKSAAAVEAPVIAAQAASPAASLAAEIQTVATPAPVAAFAELPAHDRQWLVEQLAGLGERIESSLAELNPERGSEALGARFSEFEERLAIALEGVATRTDVEALGLIEAHIGELAAHVEAAQTQLTRLGAIETHLNAVTAQLSDDRLAQLVPAHSAAPTPQELADIATTAAEQAASRVQRHAPANAVDNDLPLMRAMMERFIEERRFGDEQTVSMLDTMQQALIRVLDRMDALESSRHRGAAAHASPFGHEAVDMLSPTPSPRPAYAAAQAPVSAGFAGAPHSIASHPASAQPSPAPAATSPRVEPHLDPQSASAAVGSEADLRPIDRLRQDFRADAQRAKTKLAVEASEPAAVKLDPAAKVAARKSAVGIKPELAAKSLFSIGGRRNIVVGGLALVVAIMGGMLLMPGEDEAPRPASAKTERLDKPARAKAKADASATPSVETRSGSEAASGDADPAAGNSGAAAPAAPKPRAQGQTAPSPAGKTGAASQPRSIPETGIDDLSLGEPSGDQPFAAVPEASASADDKVVPLGGEMINPLHAPLASALTRVEGDPPVVPAALSTPAKATSASGGQTSGALDLPPLTVGPLSLRLAAAKGDASAEFEVGSRLAEGKGTGQNFKEALRWYQRSAQRGFAQAQYRLGTLYERGLGTSADLGRARTWYERAAAQGNVKAMHNLAVLSAGRETGTPDYASAATWFQQAADRNLADSQFNIGVLHESGLGVEKDLKLAYKWFSLAAAGGDREAVRRRDQVKPLLAASDLAEAELLVKAYAPVAVDPMINDARMAGEDWKKRQDVAASAR
ncbi:MAG: hypothetical protein ACT4N2_05155 [Hyphomicrobium sp.]